MTVESAFATLSDADYRRFKRLLIETAGIYFGEQRREVLRLHLRDRALATGCDSFSDYADLVESGEDRDELQNLFNQVAIHQTEFFRNRPHYEGLRSKVLPEVIARARQSRRRIRFWSAGCSSGEEPYSLAISLLELLGNSHGWDIKIHATDISTEVLGRARAALYAPRHMEGVDDERRSRWFVTEPNGYYRVREEIRSLVEFGRQNLVHDPPPLAPGEADVVFCCNVTIYFSKDALERVIASLEETLRPGGYLFLGHSESLWSLPHHLELVDIGDSFAYRRPDPDRPGGRARPSILRPAPTSAESRSVVDVGAVRVGPARGIADEIAVDADQSDELSGSDDAVRLTGHSPDASVVEPGVKAETPGSGLEHVVVAEIVAAAQGHLERGEIGEAAAMVRDALELAPTEAALHFLLGSAEQRAGNTSDALESFSKAIYCDPDFSLAYFYKAVLAEEAGEPGYRTDYENALRCLESDAPGRWDAYLESMSHEGLIDICLRRLGGAEAGRR